MKRQITITCYDDISFKLLKDLELDFLVNATEHTSMGESLLIYSFENQEIQAFCKKTKAGYKVSINKRGE